MFCKSFSSLNESLPQAEPDFCAFAPKLRSGMLKQPNIVSFCSVMTAGIVLLSLPTRMNNQLKWMVAGVFLPFLGLAEAVDEKAESLQSIVVSKQELRGYIGCSVGRLLTRSVDFVCVCTPSVCNCLTLREFVFSKQIGTISV